MSIYQSFFFRSEKSYWNRGSNVSQRNLCCKCQCSNGFKDVSINFLCLLKVWVRPPIENSEIRIFWLPFFNPMKKKKQRKNGERVTDFMDWKTISEMLGWGLTKGSLTAKYNCAVNLFQQRLLKSCHFCIIQSAYKRTTQSCTYWSQEEFQIENCFHDVSLQGINTFLL